MTNLGSILKIRDITLPTKVHLVKAMVFPVVMYGCESWTLKKAEHQRIDAFECWCKRRLLRVPWTARRSNQSILNTGLPGNSQNSVEWMNLYLYLCKTQNSGLRSKEEKLRDPISQPSRCNTQEGLLSVAQTGDPDLLGGRAHRTANWASFL